MTTAWKFIKKEILEEVFSCDFCKNFKNIFFTQHFLVTATK